LESIILLAVFIYCIFLIPKYISFRNSTYKDASGNSFLRTIYDKGKYGEFLTFLYLEKLSSYKRLMTNLYLPKSNEETTEIDLLMLTEKGIYVFESKNYSGWIFGDEKNKNWTQTLQNKQKNRFFNPIWQNKGHINALKSTLGINGDTFYKSFIIFSERCTLKKINVTSPNVKVIKRNQLIRSIKEDINNSSYLLSKEEIDKLYTKLRNYTHTNDLIKRTHVENIKAKKNSNRFI